jgi:CoA:oxalate CoA-transferase
VLQPADVWCASVLQWPELLASEGFKVLDMLQTVTRPDKVRIDTTRAPPSIDGVRPATSRAAPRIGEHAAALRAEFGL